MSGTNAELIAWGKMLGGREQELADALEAATAYEMFAVLGTDKDGGDWITSDKYDDIESARAYSKLFGGTVHRCSVGEWIKAAR